jgi:DNA mismatch repair protein MutL
VKELVENALDAGATEVSVALERGDDLRITVVDDGTGMGREDALLAFERHATSKIADLADLEGVATLGFRGEALAAIGAVAEVEMLTSAAGSEGTRVVVRGGERVAAEAAARSRGTTVRVTQLFFNTPARRKFQKTSTGESRAVTREVIAHALAAPGVGFALSENGKTRLRLAADLPLAARVAAVYGEDLEGSLIAVSGIERDARLKGIVSAPRATRGTPDAVTIAVNGRPIESRSLLRALLQGYEPLLPARRYPVAVLAIEVPPHRVDPNVHPTKKEVRFADEGGLFRLVRRAVAAALAGEGIVPDLAARDGREAGGGDEAAPHGRFGDGAGDRGPALGGFFEAWEGGALREGAAPAWDASPAGQASAASGPGIGGAAPVGAPVGRALLETLVSAPHVIQVHRTYLVAESPDGILLVDQHTAHERILYEEGLARLERGRGASQPLLVPAAIELPVVEAQLLEEFAEPLERLGFGVRAIGPSAFAIEAVPAERRGDDAGRWLREILDNLARDAAPRDRLVRAARSYACKTAVRAGDPLAPAEIRGLLARLARAENPFACPHGRPVVARVTLHEIERLFGRR